MIFQSVYLIQHVTVCCIYSMLFFFSLVFNFQLYAYGMSKQFLFLLKWNEAECTTAQYFILSLSFFVRYVWISLAYTPFWAFRSMVNTKCCLIDIFLLVFFSLPFDGMITITHVRIYNYLSNEKSIYGFEVVAHSQFNLVAVWMVSKCRKKRVRTPKQRVEKGVRRTEKTTPTNKRQREGER